MCVPIAEEREANEVLAALERDFELLPDVTQEQVRQFLARRVNDAQETARAEGDPDWRNRLSEILDYQRWFELRAGVPGTTQRRQRTGLASAGPRRPHAAAPAARR